MTSAFLGINYIKGSNCSNILCLNSITFRISESVYLPPQAWGWFARDRNRWIAAMSVGEGGIYFCLSSSWLAQLASHDLHVLASVSAFAHLSKALLWSWHGWSLSLCSQSVLPPLPTSFLTCQCSYLFKVMGGVKLIFCSWDCVYMSTMTFLLLTSISIISIVYPCHCGQGNMDGLFLAELPQSSSLGSPNLRASSFVFYPTCNLGTNKGKLCSVTYTNIHSLAFQISSFSGSLIHFCWG